MKYRIFSPKAQQYLTFAALTVWLFWIFDEESYNGFKIPYGIVAALTVWAVCHRQREKTLTGFQKLCCGVGAAFFALAVTLANYNSIPYFFVGVLYYLCALLIGMECFRYLILRESRQTLAACPRKPWMVFLATMGPVAAIDLTVLYNCYYPGLLSIDSIMQIQQLISGVYSNHHPYYHTKIIGLFYNLGMTLFQDPNRAIFLYSVFQILTLAAVMGYGVMTLYEKGFPVKWLALVILWYVIMPFHVMYSFTMWKDVLWGAAVLLFLTALYRLYYGIGKGAIGDHLLLTLGAMGFCLLRSNGWLAFALTVILFLFFFARKYPKLAAIFVCVLVCSWVLKGPVLEKLNVTQPDSIESLSIPAQQIARVIYEGQPLTQEEEELLSLVVDIDRVAETYTEYISDYIKGLVRETGDQQVLVSRKGDFLKLWLGLGARYPWTYIKAWVEQTCGYWNGGVNYWFWTDFTASNDLGIYVHIVRPGVRELWEHYLEEFIHPFTVLFISIGFHTWLVAAACLVSLAKGCWREAFLTVPLLAVIGSLMIATPVYAEFRYVYAMFVSMPLILLPAFGPGADQPDAGRIYGTEK